MKTTPTIAKIVLPNHLGIGFSSGRGPAHEGGIKRVPRESEYDGHDSHENLYDPCCQDVLPLKSDADSKCSVPRMYRAPDLSCR